MSTSEMDVPAAAAATRVSPRTRDALSVLGAAAVLGIAGDALLRAVPLGINLTVWTAALAGIALVLQARATVSDAARAWAAAAFGFALLAAWRDSPALKALDLLGLLLAIGMGMYHAHGYAVRRGTITAYAAGLAASLGEAIGGAAVLLFGDVRWAELRASGGTRITLAAVRGLLLAAPVLLVFTMLLTAADAGFQRLVETALFVRPDVAVSHVALTAVLAWGTAGVLRPLVLDTKPPLAAPIALPWRPRLGIVETATVLGLVNLLFLAFLAVQLDYLFGGAAAVTAPGETTFSSYARRGFFELVAVVALVLPLLLTADWALERRSRRDTLAFRFLAGGVVALTGVLIGSALHRMALYVGAYGVTELRLYSTAFMLWLAAVLAWFGWTVLRDRRDRFAFGALAAAVEVVALLHIANPDGVMVRVNAGRSDAAARFDVAYAASLSGDAVPALVDALPRLSPAARCDAVDRLRERWIGTEGDWRAWSLSRHRARAAVATLTPCAAPAR